MLGGVRNALARGIRSVREAAVDGREFWGDWRRYVRWATPTEGSVRRDDAACHVETQVAKDSHRVEKAFAVREPRRPFGAGPGERLAALLPPGDAAADWVVHGREALAARDRWNATGERDAGLAVPVEPWPGLDADVLDRFFASRYSLRDFDPDRVVTRADVERATALAQRTPSVCNRQAARVHAYLDRAAVARVMALHQGSAGFADDIPAVAILTVDTRLMAGPGERNQRWIDGGLFAMSFAWALHGLGIGNIMLNWSRTNADTDALRRVAGIPDHEDVLVLVGMGYPREGARRTRSLRRPRDEVLTFH